MQVGECIHYGSVSKITLPTEHFRSGRVLGERCTVLISVYDTKKLEGKQVKL